MQSKVFTGFALSLCLATSAVAETRGVKASAEDHSGTAFFGVGQDLAANMFERVQGTFEMQVTDRVQNPALPSGDKAQLHVSIRRGVDKYEIDLIDAGFANGAGAPSVPVGGGVELDRDVFGFTGQGPSLVTQAHAAISMWGMARVSLNGQASPVPARVFAAALSKGVHSDDDGFHMVNQARAGDTEFVMIVDHLPTSIDARSFLELGFEDVNITVDGRAIPKQLVVDSVASDDSTPASVGTGGGGFGGGVPTPYLGTLPGNSGSASGTTSSASSATATAVPTHPTTSQILGPDSLTPGIPASVPVANSGSGAPPPLNASSATPLPQGPSPANAQSATPLPSTPSPLNASPAAAVPTAAHR